MKAVATLNIGITVSLDMGTPTEPNLNLLKEEIKTKVFNIIERRVLDSSRRFDEGKISIGLNKPTIEKLSIEGI